MAGNIHYSDITVGEYQTSLAKLTGKRIKDVVGYLTDENSGVCFKVTHIIFDDDTQVGVEGEHDFPYLVDYTRNGRFNQPNMDEETMERLNAEQDETDD